MKAQVINWLGAIVFCLLLGSAWQLDADDNHGDWATSAELQELQAAEAGTARHEAAAQALCNEARGPNSEARFTPEGHLVCSTRRGMRSHASAQSAVP